MKTTKIDQNWTVHPVGTDQYYTADIPAMAMQILYENGKIPDPYRGENEWIVYEALRKDFEFSNTFEVTGEMYDSDELILRFEGLDTAAEIYVNDLPAASVNDMHRTYLLDVKDKVRVGENSIRICFRSGIEYALEQHAKEPYYSIADTVDGFSLVRKAHSTYGWDWGPKLPDVGIWRMVSLNAYNTAKLEDIYIRQIHENGAVRLRIETKIRKFTKDETTLEVTVKDPDGKVVQKVGQEAGENEITELLVKEPRLWWCNGFGAQPLYEIICTLKKGEEVLEENRKRVGLRTLTVRREKDSWGESFEFCVNGVSVFAMGANYIPEDCFYTRCSRERSEQLILQCIRANYNSIRVWGGGYFCDDWFYDLCDEYGLIVWQDLLFACGVYRLHEEFVENVVQETIDNVKRLRHHASIALWCGNNELEWGWSGWDMGFGDRLQDKADYLKLFEWILPQTVKKIDPDRFYWLASPSSGGSFDEPNDQNRGDVHYWDVWHRLKHFTEYRKYHFRFCSEFGFQSFPSKKTIDTFAEEKDKNIFSPVMENHQKNRGANGLILYYLSANFRYPRDFETLLYVSQILQAEAIRYGVEHWRSNRGRCMGALYWQVNDCWPVASWSSLDYYNRWKPLHYYAKKFYAPVLLSALEENGNIRFVVSNETMEMVKAKVVWRLRKQDGEIAEEHSAEMNVERLCADECAAADYSRISQDRLESRKYYVEYLLFVNGEETTQGSVLFCRPKHFEFADPQITWEVKEAAEEFLLTVKTSGYAKYIWIDSDTFDFVADDNCFDLSKGTEKVIRIAKGDITKEGKQYQASMEEMKNLKVLSVYDIR